jgi:hypothetical protein
MAEGHISGIIINRVTRVGDIGEPGYSVFGEEVPACKYSGKHDSWHGATQDNLGAVMPSSYITRSVYEYLTGAEIEEIRSRVRGVVENDYAYRTGPHRDETFGRQYYCWEVDLDKLIPGLPEPRITCTPSGSFTSVPSQISASIKTGFPVLTTTLPVTLTLARDCVSTFDKVATTPAPIGSLPVIFSINDIDIPPAYPTTRVLTPLRAEYPITLDLATYLTTWKHLLSTATTALTLKARVEEQLIACGGYFGDVGFKAFSAEITIPVSVCECDEGETRNPLYCWDWSTIDTEICSGGLWIPTGNTCPEMPAHGTKGGEITCGDGSVINTKIFDANVKDWIPSGESCTIEPGAGEKRNPTTCWDGTVIHAEKYDATLHLWIPSGEVCPTEPGAGEKRNPTTCWDGTVIYGEVFREGVWVSTGAKCPTEPAAGEKRNPTTCRDGSVINQEVYVDGAWIPSGEKCPEDLPSRTMMAAIPKIMYEGQAVDIVVGAYIGAAPSTDETAILTIDGTEASRMNTKAGEVTFRWTAEGVGMHNLCATIPPNINLPTPGSICKTIMVSADIGSVKEQVKSEMESYRDELEMLRKKKQLAREQLKRYVPPGSVGVPASLAGSSIEIGGIIRTVPPEGMTIPISAGDHQIVVIVEGIRKMIPVIVLPGEEVMLL